jgi:hypothetical protein
MGWMAIALSFHREAVWIRHGFFLGASACEHAAMGMSTMTIANDQVDWEQASLTRTDQNDAEDK